MSGPLRRLNVVRPSSFGGLEAPRPSCWPARAPIDQVMVMTGTPKLARALLGGAVVMLAVVIARDAFGVIPPVGAAVWDKAYNAAELLGFAACALRAVHSRGAERASWAALSVGLLGFLGGDLYWTIFLTGMG